MKPWLAEFIRLEMLWLLQTKIGESKSDAERVQYMASVERKYVKTSDGLKICCKARKDSNSNVHLDKIIGTSGIVSATVGDSACLVNAKFARAAREACIKDFALDLASLKPGALLKIVDFEWHLTLYGDDARKISLLVKQCEIVETTALKPPAKNKPLLVDIQAIFNMVPSLLHSETDRHSLSQAISLANEANYGGDDSDIASQDGQPLASQSGIASQVPLSSFARSREQKKDKAESELEPASGVNLSAPQRPKKRARPLDFDPPDSRTGESNAQQLLCLLARHGAATRKEPVSQHSAASVDATEPDPPPATLDKPDIPVPNATQPSVPVDMTQPPRDVHRSISSSRFEQIGYCSTHRGDFNFVVDAVGHNGPDDEQRNLLRHPASWYHPEPCLQFPGLNVPFDVLTSFKSYGEAKPTTTDQPQDLNAHVQDSTTADCPSAVLEAEHYPREISPVKTSEVAVPSCSPSKAPETPTSSGTMYSGWSPSIPSSAMQSAGKVVDEPRDSSAEKPKPSPYTVNSKTAATMRKSCPPSSPPESRDLEKLSGSRDPTPSTQSHAEEPAQVARRSKQSFVAARRAQKSGLHLNSLDVHDEPEVEMHVAATSPEIASSPSLRSSLRFLESAQRLKIPKPSLEIIPGSYRFDGGTLAEPGGFEADTTDSQDLPCSAKETFCDQLLENNWTPFLPSSSRAPLQHENATGNRRVTPKVGETDDSPKPFYSAKSRSSEHDSLSVHASRRSPCLTDGPTPSPSNLEDADALRTVQLNVEASTGHGSLCRSSIIDPNSGRATPFDFTKSEPPEDGSTKNKCTEQKGDVKPTSIPSGTKQWWKTDDTIFKRFAREYASLKVFGGLLGEPGEHGELVVPERKLELLQWCI